jgi:hypothetical protein
MNPIPQHMPVIRLAKVATSPRLRFFPHFSGAPTISRYWRKNSCSTYRLSLRALSSLRSLLFKLSARLAPNNSVLAQHPQMIHPYTYHRLTPNHPPNTEGVSWRFPRFAGRRSGARKPVTQLRRPAQRPRIVAVATPSCPPGFLRDLVCRSSFGPSSLFRHSLRPSPFPPRPPDTTPDFPASLEISTVIHIDVCKSVSKARKTCAPLAPNTSARAHNSTEFVPPCASTTLENTALPRAPAKLIPRLSCHFPDFSRGQNTNSK